MIQETLYPCPEHGEGCVAVVATNEHTGRVIWRSHNTPAISVGARLNPDAPISGTDRWTLATPEEAALMGWSVGDHRRAAFDAMQRDLFTAQELAAISDILGVNATDLRAEANEKGWDRILPPLPSTERS